ncbi:MAG: ABC transporter permease subunit [Rhodobacteraceae bacterium]|nr:ABC transporter permease subunit [Paracoccaceae bacterium]
MPTIAPPKNAKPLQKQEARLAWGLLAPTVTSVALIVLLPLLAIFWISFKPVSLGDLRAPVPLANERLRGEITQPGDTATIQYRLRNSNSENQINGVTLTDTIPAGLSVSDLDPRCDLAGRQLTCEFGDWEGGHRETLELTVTAEADFADGPPDVRASTATMDGSGENVLTSLEFTFENFMTVFEARDFLSVLWATVFYTVVGTVGALVAGLFAALLLNQTFRGRGFLRGLFLFPYVAPVIAAAFTWVTLFDPFSGSANALLLQMGFSTGPINFFGERPLALIMVTVFEIWRYFPLSFLFILARMQAVDTDIFEAANMDGASPFQKFRYLLLPQLFGILSVLFLLRFIWTFNKFDDIFLLTGGNAGTRTLTVNVYEQAFAVADIGAGAAVAVVIFLCLLGFSTVYFWSLRHEEEL